MKACKIAIFGLFCFVALSCVGVGVAQAQATPTPAPSPGPAPAASEVTLSAMLEEMVTNFVAFRQTFNATVEGTLGGYFSILAYILAWIIAIYFFSQQFIRGEWDAAEIGRYTGRVVVCLLLLIFCGDVDGDGRRGDLVRGPNYIGQLLAYGETSTNSTEGNYISRLVRQEADKYNRNYKTFVENKLMVRINDRDMPIRYPGMTGIQTVAAVYVGQGTQAQNKEVESQAFWIGLEFQVLNACRSIIALLDFFLLVLHSIGVLILVLIAPFMVSVFVNRDFAKRFTYPFFWTVVTLCVIFPALAQAARYFAYLSANMALGTSANPNFTFDPTTNSIIANGDPTPMILVAILCMLVSIICLAMSAVLSYALAQGRLVEAVSGLIANTFAGLSSVGLGAAVTGYTTKLQAEGEKAQIQGAADATTTLAQSNFEGQKASATAALQANEVTATSGYQATMTTSQAQLAAAGQSATGQYLSSMASVNAERFQSVNGAVANFRHNYAGLQAEEKKAYADNLVELLRSNGDATSQRIAKEIEMAPEKAELLADQYENILNGMGIAGSVAKQFGLNKDGINAWTRTEGFKTLGQWVFGNPDTLQGGKMQNGTISGNIARQNQQTAQALQAPGSLVFERPDGTRVDALTGKRLSNNITDMTNPNAPASPGAGPSVAGIFAGGGKGPAGLGKLAPGGRMTKQQRANYASLNRVMRSDPNFLPTLQRESWARGIDPNNVLNMLAIESGFRKDVINSDGYLGLGQVGRSERASIGRGWTGNDATDLARVRNMSPSQQLDSLVFPFVDKKFGNQTRGITMDKLYAGWGSGHFRKDPNYVHMAKDGKRSLAYAANPQWDVNKDGQVQQWEFGPSAYRNLGAGVYFDANKALGQIRSVDPATAKVLAKQYGADATLTNSLANNAQAYQGKNQATASYFAAKGAAEQNLAQDQINIANQKAGIQAGGAQQMYDSQMQAAQTTFGGQSAAAGITRQGTLQAGQINYQGAMGSATFQLQGQTKAAEITRQAAVQALHQRNIATLLQNVGNSTAHQISELFERASRGM